MADYATLGSRQVMAAPDETGLNPGNFTTAFTPDLLPSVAQFEIYRAVVTGVPAGTTGTVMIGNRPVSFTAPGPGGGSEWDPNQAPIVLKGQEVDFLWSSGPAPAVPATRGNASPQTIGVDTTTATWAVNPVAGQKVLVYVMVSDGETISSVTDNGAVPSTFTLDVAADHVNDGIAARIYRADNISLPATGAYAVTINCSGGHHINFVGVAYSGLAPGGPTSFLANNVGNASPVNTGNIIAAKAGALYAACFTEDTTSGAETITLTGAGFTSQFSNTGASGAFYSAAADKIDPAGPAATACTWTYTQAVGYASVIAVYDVAVLEPIVTTIWLRYDTSLPGNIGGS